MTSRPRDADPAASVWTAFARVERAVWTGLLRGVRGRPQVPPGAVGFTHHRALAPARWCGLGVLTMETAVLHLLIPDGPVRWALLVIGLYSIVWVLGSLLGAGVVRPHVVDADVLLLRRGLGIDIRVPLAAVAEVRTSRRHGAETAGIQLDGDVLHLIDNGGTTLDLVLVTPLMVTLPRRPAMSVTEIRIWVDEPTAMAECIRRRTAAPALPRGRPRRNL